MPDPASLPLRDIHLPPEPPWWPPPVGWWLLAAVVLLLAAWWLWRRHARRAWLRAAERELQELERDWHARRDAAALLAGLSCLLRRVQIHLGHRRATLLYGRPWITSLGWLAPVPETLAARLEDGPYRRAVALRDAEVARLMAQVRNWLHDAAPGWP